MNNINYYFTATSFAIITHILRNIRQRNFSCIDENKNLVEETYVDCLTYEWVWSFCICLTEKTVHSPKIVKYTPKNVFHYIINKIF